MPEPTDFDLDAGSEVRVIASSKQKVNWSFIIFIIIVVSVGVVLVFQKDDKLLQKEKNLEKASEAFSYIDVEESKLTKLGYFLPPGTGRIIPHWDYLWELNAETSGTVISINNQVNDLVKKGETIVVLENKTLKTEAYQHEIAITLAEKHLEYVKSKKTGSEIEELNEAVKKAELECDKIKNKLELSLPFEGITVSSLEINNLSKELESCNSILKRDNALCLSFLRTVEDEIRQAKKSLETIEQGLQILKDKIANLEINAPADLKILEINIQMGQVVDLGDEILSLYDANHVVVSLLTSYMSFPRFEIGRKAKIFIDANPNKAYPGEVIALRPLNDQRKNNFDVIIKFINPDEKILIGCTAQIEYIKEKSGFLSKDDSVTNESTK
ncbi:MAG: HlyD family efflux transporter periplasmic adaptor subunit [Planctomycetes bacterium]|nr:HlyD family efflux transporter periplasmic adaptor subunit [Planctomycetota bacterium]